MRKSPELLRLAEPRDNRMARANQSFCPGYPPILGESRLLDEVELQASLMNMLRHWNGRSDLWIFGYGSLIWNPGLPVAERACARIYGYHRGLYLWSRVNRGTPQWPGLVLALDRGGSCTGVAFRLAAQGAMPHLQTLWRREMPMGAYRPAWLPCRFGDGRQMPALAFVMRRDVPAYTGRLADETIRTVLGRAHGRYGSTLDYVERTASALRENGMPDLTLERLLKRCV